MGSGMSGLGGFARGFQQGYSFVTDEQKKAQEAEAREMQLEDEKAIRKAYKEMPDFQNYQRPIYREGVTPPGKDFVGPPDPSQVEGYVHNSAGYMDDLRKAADNIKDPVKRQVFTTAGMQNLYDNSQRYGIEAYNMFKTGQREAGLKALQKMYAYLPDGKDVTFNRDPETNEIYSMTLRDVNGKVIQDQVPVPDDEQMMLFAAMGADPKQWFTIANAVESNRLQRSKLQTEISQFNQLFRQREDYYIENFAIQREALQQKWADSDRDYKLAVKALNDKIFHNQFEREVWLRNAEAAEAAAKSIDPVKLAAMEDQASKHVENWFKTNPELKKLIKNEADAAMASTAIAAEILRYNGSNTSPADAATIAVSMLSPELRKNTRISVSGDPRAAGIIMVGGDAKTGSGRRLYAGPRMTQLLTPEYAAAAEAAKARTAAENQQRATETGTAPVRGLPGAPAGPAPARPGPRAPGATNPIFDLTGSVTYKPGGLVTEPPEAGGGRRLNLPSLELGLQRAGRPGPYDEVEP